MNTSQRDLLLLTLVPLLASSLLVDNGKAQERRDEPPKVVVKLVGKVNLSDGTGSPMGLVVVGNYAYVTAGNRGLNVVDVSDPTAPRKIASCNLRGSARDVAVSGTHAFVAAQEGGLRVVDVANPEAPAAVGSYLPRVVARSGVAAQWGPVVEAVAVTGRHAYVAYNYVPHDKDAWSSLLQVLDVSNPKAPAELGSFEAARSGLFLGVAVAGKYAYVADKDGTLHVVNVSDPRAPAEVGFCEGVSEPQGIVVAGNHAYLADDDGAMYIVDVSDPKKPKKVGAYADQGDRPGLAEAIAVQGQYAYVCDDGGGRLLVVDVSDPAAPREVASFESPGQTVGVVVAGEYVYVNVMRSGLFILRLAGK